MKNLSIAGFFAAFLPIIITSTALADGVAIDTVYSPYVELMEQELEWRVTAYEHPDNDSLTTQIHRFGYGRSFGEHWFGEIYLSGEKSTAKDFEVEAYEAEVRYQLTEQGEYWADFGLLFELEKIRGRDIWETKTGILTEKEHGNYSTKINLLLGSEWGGEIKDEIETSLAVQTRYRYSQGFEPAVEFHKAEDTEAIGPVMLGSIKLGNRRNLRWEAGYFIGLDSKTPDNTLRASVEYEF